VADAGGVGTWSSSSWGGTDVTVSLLSSSASGGAGTVTASFPDITRALAGSVISGVAGNAVREISQALSGATSSGATGSGGVLYEITPSGRVASGLTGTIAFGGATKALTGASAAQGFVGTFVPNTTAFYTGTVSGATGWSSGAWSDAAWGGAGDFTATSAAANAGTVVSQVAPSITGSGGFAVPGSVTFEMSFPLSGIVVTGAAGTWTTGKASFLSGASASGFAGNMVMVKVVPISGNQAKGENGNVGYAYWQLIDDSQNPDWTDIITV